MSELSWLHTAKRSEAHASDGTVWHMMPYPGYMGSPGAVTLVSTLRGGVKLQSHHVDYASAKRFAQDTQDRPSVAALPTKAEWHWDENELVTFGPVS